MPSSSSHTPADQPPSISARERQVLSRVAAGMTSKEIAAALGITVRTVHAHRESLAKKLGTSSVATLTRYALEHHIEVD